MSDMNSTFKPTTDPCEYSHIAKSGAVLNFRMSHNMFSGSAGQIGFLGLTMEDAIEFAHFFVDLARYLRNHEEYWYALEAAKRRAAQKPTDSPEQKN